MVTEAIVMLLNCLSLPTVWLPKSGPTELSRLSSETGLCIINDKLCNAKNFSKFLLFLYFLLEVRIIFIAESNNTTIIYFLTYISIIGMIAWIMRMHKTLFCKENCGHWLVILMPAGIYAVRVGKFIANIFIIVIVNNLMHFKIDKLGFLCLNVSDSWRLFNKKQKIMKNYSLFPWIKFLGNLWGFKLAP